MPSTEKIRFGTFEFDFHSLELRKRGTRIALQPLAGQALRVLLKNSNRVVSREELRRELWPADTFVDFEHGINNSLARIREALSDSADTPRFVETLPRRGYRFIGALEPILQETAAPADRDPQSPDLHIPATESTAKPRWLILAATASASLALCVFVLAWFAKSDAVIGVAGLSPVTTYAGDEREPTLSPDGRKVAFSWGGENGESRHIYVTGLGEQRPVRLTGGLAEDGYPAWSPAGHQIAFIRRRTELEGDIVLISAVGAPERILRRIRIGGTIGDPGRLLAWSADGRWLCFPDVNTSGHYDLFLLSLETGRARRLFSRSADGIGDSSPAFSPDGRWLAFARFTHPFNSRLFLQKLSSNLEPDGVPRAVRGGGVNPRLPVWMPDSKNLLFLSASKAIMRAGVKSAQAHPFYVASAELDGLTMSARAPVLIASRHEDNEDIWTMSLGSGGLRAIGSPRQIAYSTASEEQPHFSPDGRWLSFISSRTGASEVWLAAADGSNPKPLTRLGAYIAGYPRWSPDSKFLAFHARFLDEAEVYVINIEDGTTRQITSALPDSFAPSWSMDGRFLYIGAHRNGQTHVDRVSVRGGNPQELWKGDGEYPMEAPGRQLLLYSKTGQPGVYARSLAGNPAANPEQRLFDDYSSPIGGFDPVSDGVFYTGLTPAGVPRAFRFYSFATRTSVDIAPAPRNLICGLSVTRDRTRIAYAVNSTGSEDLVQIELK